MTTEQSAPTNAAAVRLVSPFPDEAAPQIFDQREAVRGYDHGRLLPEYAGSRRAVGSWRCAVNVPGLSFEMMKSAARSIGKAFADPGDLHCIFKKSFWGRYQTIRSRLWWLVYTRHPRDDSEEIHGYGGSEDQHVRHSNHESRAVSAHGEGNGRRERRHPRRARHSAAMMPVDLVSISVPRDGFYRSLDEPLPRRGAVR